MAELTVSDKLDFLVSITHSLTKEIRQEILQWIVINIGNATVHESAAGCHVRMSSWTDKQVEDCYQFVKHKIEN